MEDNNMLDYIQDVLENMPSDWLGLTTHRLDIYNEELAKKEFIAEFEILYKKGISDPAALNQLPTAYDYIRLGHPLSCILEWLVAHNIGVDTDHVISFSSTSMPILAVLRKNALDGINTQINYTGKLPDAWNSEVLKTIYGYQFELNSVNSVNDIVDFEGSTIFISDIHDTPVLELHSKVDFYVQQYHNLGSIWVMNGLDDQSYIKDIQHVRRRETIAMTPANSLEALKAISHKVQLDAKTSIPSEYKAQVTKSINTITGTETKVLVASSGLSIQYAIMMGLVHDAIEQHQGKAIKIIVPPNCYGGTNDQARRVAAAINNVEIVDLPVDGNHDMVDSIHTVLEKIAIEDAVPYIIAEIPTNPRVEVPNLIDLKKALNKVRKTKEGIDAIDPVFILDQTFCPNVQFLGADKILSNVRTISFSSGSKFPSGGLCTAGYCVGNNISASLIDKVEKHLSICDNEATELQYEILAKQLPSMINRIHEAYLNTRNFVGYITKILPEAKINFVSEELAEQGFTPSVFSLDLPTRGESDAEREQYKRKLNLKLINMMIGNIPDQSKYCVSYGQLKGCYWTIPATSTQGTTSEGDKDYIVRASLSPDLDLEKHKNIFAQFVAQIEK